MVLLSHYLSIEGVGMYLGNVTGHGSSVDMETLVPTNPNEGLGVVEQKPSKERDSLMTRAKEFIKDSRSEEHTSELQSRGHLVCRLLLEKKKQREETEVSANLSI